MTKENLDRMKAIMASDPPLTPMDCNALIKHAEESLTYQPMNVLVSDDQITASRREQIATHLMAGIIAYKGLGSQSWQGVAIDAIRGTDALLAKLKE